MSQLPDNLSLPVSRNLAEAHEGREHLIVPEVLTPCVELFQRLAYLLPQQRQRLPQLCDEGMAGRRT